MYDLKPVRSLRIRGPALRLAVALLEKPAIAALAAPLLTRDLGVRELRAARIVDPPTFLPLHPTAVRPEAVPLPVRRSPCPPFRSVRDYQDAYRNGVVTPEEIADRVLASMRDSDRLPRPLRAFIACDRDDVLAQARAATQRHKDGRALGPLDGVPVAVKDEIDMVPYPTTAGTRFFGSAAAQADATVVARLRAAGALLIGKTNMHEIGILPNGLNPHYGPVRNPYNPAHEAGGSSSGSAAAVAAGLCPAAVGADGGGSIRIPAAFCGVVGLKPTFGRVSEEGAVPLAWSVAHLGPIGATAQDAAPLYAALTASDLQPPAEAGGLRGLRIGVYREWFSDAAADVVAACRHLLDQFVRLGAELVDVVIPELRLMAVAHGLTIHAEMEASMSRYDHRNFGLSTRLMLANVRAMRASDYVQAQRIRTRAMEHFRSALAGADVIATPSTPISAPEISEGVDISQVVEVMRFINPANLTGLPAISVPAGYDRRGLPVGLQLIGRPWAESTLLRLAYSADEIVPRQKPPVWFDMLPELGH